MCVEARERMEITVVVRAYGDSVLGGLVRELVVRILVGSVVDSSVARFDGRYKSESSEEMQCPCVVLGRSGGACVGDCVGGMAV